MILHAMLQRLYASLVHGPSMNARPHRSRQRCDLMDLTILRGTEPDTSLRALLENGKVDFPAKVKPFTGPESAASPAPAESIAATPSADSAGSTPSEKPLSLTPEQRAARDAWLAQSKLLKKLRDIAEDATDYQNDHGESCLALGFPLLSMPPGADDTGIRQGGRILAPLLLLPLDLQVRTASRTGVTLTCTGTGADLLVPNPALLAWLERQTGKTIGELFTDDEAADPWREVSELLRQISTLLGLETPAAFTAETILASVPPTEKLPNEVTVLPSAVLGLFPLSNQSLLRDTRWMEENEKTLTEPVSSFLSPEALVNDHDEPAAAAVEKCPRHFASEWFVSPADPCQANAVLAAREAKALVVHGPPGTGKSQTITNMIADHLARRQRVLFVCDKRTALDVVKYRLDATGLGDLCGVVHDPGADRKDFYMGLRNQLETLADTPVPADPRQELDSTNQQLNALHTELDGARRKLHDSPDAQSQSFHNLLGTFLDLSLRTEPAPVTDGSSLTIESVHSARTNLEEISRRAVSSGYAGNSLRGMHTANLQELLTLSTQDIRAAFTSIHEAARAADTARPGEAVLDANSTLQGQATDRRAAATLLRKLATADEEIVRRMLELPGRERKVYLGRLSEETSTREYIAKHEFPFDRSLVAAARAAGLAKPFVALQKCADIGAWLNISESFWKRLFGWRQKREALAALQAIGLPFPDGLQQGHSFYSELHHRLLLGKRYSIATGEAEDSLPEDDISISAVNTAADTCRMVDAWIALRGSQPVPENSAAQNAAAALLEAEASWAEALDKTLTQINSSRLFRPETVEAIESAWCAGKSAAADAAAWLEHASTLEDMVRLSAALDQLPASMRTAADTLALKGAPAAEMLDAFTLTATAQAIRARLQSDPQLAAMDGDRMEAAFNSFLTLSRRKMELVKQSIRRTWLLHQRDRLLSTTASQLGKHGSALRQRLYVKGKRALKLRQMLATGEGIDGGDPLYDLCPVWMASPATVAQIFPRHALFDVVIFDEASQCRLEEALPVLLRGQRVVIAGDQKQLPPTRFFESALADSGDSDAETAEELFFQQQTDAEDLLTAALNLDVREAYLDVHYRSRNEALIGFSNETYYGSRLQPIPGHPKNRTTSSPITLHRVDGVYEDRSNVKEAAAAVDLVASLLAEPSPPSIGLACFNLTQRDAILDALEEKCATDSAFAGRLAVARKRQGRDSFEGLFVKNLENVQGDERDVMIISTTFGPDPQGKFRRNFGVLSTADGGRRLNVLVTRARTAIHVFTSIPAAEYNAITPAPPGTHPNGRLQLYAYLRYIESLTQLIDTTGTAAESLKPKLHVWPSAVPSPVAESMGETLLQQRATGSHVHWGNDGFCVDVACIHPQQPDDVTVGILTDFSRYHKTPDPIEWDLFRTEVLRSQGWNLQRVWSPVLFRKREEILARITTAHEKESASVLPPATIVPQPGDTKGS